MIFLLLLLSSFDVAVAVIVVADVCLAAGGELSLIFVVVYFDYCFRLHLRQALQINYHLNEAHVASALNYYFDCFDCILEHYRYMDR